MSEMLMEYNYIKSDGVYNKPYYAEWYNIIDA